jgi:outer membrane protein assembly factor BamB
MVGIVTLLPLLLLPAIQDEAPQWGEFRGPGGSGVVEATTLPDTLDPDETLRWRVETPRGYSSPIVVGDLLILTAVEGKELLTLCYDRDNGEELWRAAIPYDGKRIGANFDAAPTPVTDGKTLFTLFHNAGLVAYDLAGKELWRQEVGTLSIPHGLSSSPLIHEDLVIVQIDHDAGSFLAAFAKDDGKPRWKTDRSDFTHSYSTPTLYTPDEGPAEVIVSGALKICSYAAESGELLWWVGGASFMPNSRPLVHGDVCYIASYSGPMSEAGLPRFSGSFEDALAERDEDGDGKIGKDEYEHDMLHSAWFVFDLDDDGFFDERDWDYLVSCSKPTGGLFAIELGGRGAATESHVRWKFTGRREIPEFASPLLVDGTLFLLKLGGVTSTIDPKSGEVIATERLGEPDNYFASPVMADGKVYASGVSGLLTVVSAKRDWELLSATSVGEEVWSTPAIVDGQVFVRSQKALYCFEVLEE